ncbi:MAG TPA: thiamine phosphate synthase [Candidatus Acidoferrales bacterium]|nr:thiamine phosphate synthase [Candidatus Acidoferrales bacterium]
MLLCYVTDRKLLGPSRGSDALLPLIARAGGAGVDWIQIREKDLPARELLELARRAIAAVPGTTSVLINDRLDVALASGAAGVHLGAASIPVAEAARWCRAGNAPANFQVGVSCHTLREASEAERAGASYVFFGPVYETPAKMQFGPPQGITRLAEACQSVRIPVLAIGGINEDNAGTCSEAGAAGIAAIRLFQEAKDVAALSRIVARLRKLPAGE